MEKDETMRTEEEAREPQGGDANLVEALKKLKNESVPKEDYDKLLAQNKELIEAYTEGKNIDLGNDAQKHRTADEIREELFTKEHNNLNGWKLALELREAVLDETGEDIFVASPNGHQYKPTQEDYDKAQNVADVVADCIEKADGNDQNFNAFFTSRINNDTIPTMPNRRR